MLFRSDYINYLIFDADSDAFLGTLVEIDASPGTVTFTDDLSEMLADLLFPDSDLGLTPTEGILEQAVKFPYELDFRGYITDFSETSVSVDEVFWDTEGDDYPNGYAIINDDTSVTEYPLAEDCEFWILKDYWFPCQRLDFDTFSGFLETNEYNTLWVFAENEDGEIVMIGMQYQP